MMAQLLNKIDQTVLASDVIEAKTFFQRSRGLLGRKDLNQGSVMWIHSCNSIHTWFMQFSIDVVFVDSDLNVTSTHREVKPWRLILPRWRARSVFEFPAGAISQYGIKKGDALDVVN